MTQSLDLMAVMKTNFVTSSEADKYNDELMGKLGLNNRYAPARLAIARSLALNAAVDPVPASSEGDGKAIHGQNLFGDDLKLWVALLVEHTGHEVTTASALKELVKRHWHRGMLLLMDDWVRCDRDFDKFILSLASYAGVREGHSQMPMSSTGGYGQNGELGQGLSATASKALKVLLGRGLIAGGASEPVHWTLNAPGGSPHVAIMGATGTGKTRAANMLLTQLRQQAACPVILFDMGKGDLAANTNLVQSLGATVLASPRDPIPLDFLHLERTGEPDLLNTAVRFRESFERVATNRLGGQQQDALREATLRALRANRPTRLSQIRDVLVEVYSERGRKPDGVNATLNELTGWDLFRPDMTPDAFFSRSWIFDLHEATETAQRLIVFLVLDSLYLWQRSLPEAPMDPNTQHRALRLLIGIDEARKVLGYRQDSLVGLIRESRSKGLSLFLMSQSPDDYKKETDNFLENLGLILCFKTNASSNSLSAVLGQQTDLGALTSGVCVTRLAGRAGLTKIQMWEG